MHRFVQSCLLACVLAASVGAQPAGEVVLSDALGQWRDEIQETGDHRVGVARVYTNLVTGVVRLPQDVWERPTLIPYFENTNFLRQVLATHSMSVNQNLGKDNKSIHHILLNMGREAEWREYEDAVIGHEMGHIWLYVNNYSSPVYEGKDDSCLAILTGDMVQHGLIRDELERRGIDYTAYWTMVLDQSLAHLEGTEPIPWEKAETCSLMSQMSTWVDARLGLSPEKWTNFDRFQSEMRRHFPILEREANGFVRELGKANLSDPEVYHVQLQNTLQQMYGFVRLVLKRGERPPGLPTEQARNSAPDG